MKVVEKFTSINGEGTRAGELAVFVALKDVIFDVVIVIPCGPMKPIVLMKRKRRKRLQIMFLQQESEM